MSDRDREPRDVDTSERMGILTSAMADATKHKARGEHETEQGARHTVDPAQVEVLIKEWPEAPKMAARQMLEQYGPPNEATPTKLFWYRNGPWKRTELTSDVVIHNFPSPHSDYLTQYIDYQVPIDKFDEIARFDGSCLVDRTSGEAAARCDSEAANILTLNLMHDIVTGKTSVEEARKTYAENMAGYTMGRSAPYVEQFQFAVPQGGTEDPDESMIGGAMARQTLGKVKDVLTGSESGERQSF
ncbi:MAG: hypothetical protein M3P51_05085 [Chloroflexota bacterium]|nr:hypothetical protein [Chloroflexota bacterium]